jgi:hypothetical protein
MTTETDPTIITIGGKRTAPDHPVRFSFLAVFKPRLSATPKPGEQPKFSVQVILNKKSPDVPRVMEAMKAAHQADKRLRSLDFDALDLILRDGDNPKENKKKADHLKGCYFFNAWAGEEYPPQVRGTRIDAATGKLEHLTSKDVKSGDYGAVTVRFYGYEVNGNQGISAGLRGLQKRRTGASLAGTTNFDDEYDVEEDEDDDLLN